MHGGPTWSPNTDTPLYPLARGSSDMGRLADRKSLTARRALLVGSFVLTFGIVCDTPTALRAHEGATGVVKERMEAMKTIGAAMKRIAAMLRGLQDYDAAAVAEAARAIEAHGGDAMTALFPEGSAHEPSEARPVIWKDWEQFKALAQDLAVYSRALAAAAGNERGTMEGQHLRALPPGAVPEEWFQTPDPSGGEGQQVAGSSLPTSDAVTDFDALKRMPPQMAFLQLTRTCAGCHRDFRVKK